MSGPCIFCGTDINSNEVPGPCPGCGSELTLEIPSGSLTLDIFCGYCGCAFETSLPCQCPACNKTLQGIDMQERDLTGKEVAYKLGGKRLDVLLHLEVRLCPFES